MLEEITDGGLRTRLDHYIKTSDPETIVATGDLVDKANLLTWRGMMSKLLLSCYDVESARQPRGGRSNPWEMNAMVVDVTSTSLPNSFVDVADSSIQHLGNALPGRVHVTSEDGLEIRIGGVISITILLWLFL
jgi:hypothetical protein